MRDHLKDVHDLSQDLLAKLNFKGGRFRSLKTIEEKWKHAFIILFPETPKDNVPVPFKIHNNTTEKALSDPVDDLQSSHKDSCTEQVQLDITSLLGRMQNRLFDRLNSNANVPTSLRLDILANFETDFNDIIADLAGEAVLGTINVGNMMAYKGATNHFEDLNLDWNCLPTYGPTPDLEFTDKKSTSEATHFIEPILGTDNGNGSTYIDHHRVHGLPNSPLLVSRLMYDPMYNDAKWTFLQPYLAQLKASHNEEIEWVHMCQLAPFGTTSDSVTDEKKVQDFGCQLPTPPATPSSYSSAVYAKVVPEPIPAEGNSIFSLPADHNHDAPLGDISTAVMTDTKAQDEFDVSVFVSCLEDEQYYYLGSFEQDECGNRDM
ncbi:hypothetical protein SLS60_004778 [Paraconiothyrium brasiliense]|uniref:Uncharacterized protein n=1 Tax=Paraconiothyrium brasiliense TaxID=300254 RepID=A0ABR3RM77_9PLEO